MVFSCMFGQNDSLGLSRPRFVSSTAPKRPEVKMVAYQHKLPKKEVLVFESVLEVNKKIK